MKSQTIELNLQRVIPASAGRFGWDRDRPLRPVHRVPDDEGGRGREDGWNYFLGRLARHFAGRRAVE